jgi:hypothetical protein
LTVCIQRAAGGGNAVTKVILNGLVREARNPWKVGAYGNPVRYQWGAYDGMQNERMYSYIKPGGTAEALAFVPVNYRDESFFYCLKSSGSTMLCITAASKMVKEKQLKFRKEFFIHQ